jgi:hypothetical protein
VAARGRPELAAQGIRVVRLRWWRPLSSEELPGLLTPLELTNEEMEVLVGLAGPIAWRQRDAFLREVAEALAALPTRGPGVTHRIGRAIQKNYTIQARHETEVGGGGSKYSRSAQRDAREVR